MSPSRIAIIRTDRIGDMVLTLPMFPVLRRRFPDAELVLCTRRYVEPLVGELDTLGVIDHVVYVDDAPDALRQGLRRHAVDTAFFPRPRLNEVWDAIRAGVRTRIGSAFRWYSPLFTVRVRDHRSDASFHEAEYNVRMILAAFGGSMPTVALVPPAIPHTISDPSLLPERYIVIHPGSGGSARDWPAERFGEVARTLSERGIPVVITGIAAEREVCDVVRAACPAAIDLCGRTDLGATIRAIAGSSLMVANSTGVLHVAAACGIPVIGLYPSTPSMSPKRWGPYTSNAIVFESGPGDDMTKIDVNDVVDAALHLIQRP